MPKRHEGPHLHRGDEPCHVVVGMKLDRENARVRIVRCGNNGEEDDE